MHILMNGHRTDTQECNAKVNQEHVQVQCSQLSPRRCPNLHSQQQYVCSPQSITFGLNLGIMHLFNFSYSGWCEGGSHWVLIIFQRKLKNFHMPNGCVDIFSGGVPLWTLLVLCPEAPGPYCVYAFLPQLLGTVPSNDHN